jgi:phage terminase large subunit-like protein
MSDEQPIPTRSTENLSEAELFDLLPYAEKEARLAELTDEECDELLHDWEWTSRPNQREPASFTSGEKNTWLVMAGRGFGKTRVGAEWVRGRIKKSQYVNLIGATASDARDIMIEGESGILNICSKQERPEYIASKRQLQWPNGAVSLVFTADEPERLRGKQHSDLWADELGSWRYSESWDQAMFGLRLGNQPQAVVTTTPRPTKLVKDLIKSVATAVTRGSTYDNRKNLAKTFLDTIITKYEGTRLGRQELMAELLEDNPGALWHQTAIDLLRVSHTPMLLRIIVAIDPSVEEEGKKDEAGIVVAGLGVDDHIYILDDLSLHGSPNAWANRAVVHGFRKHMCDRIVAEINNGGALVEAVLRTVDPSIPYTPVHASRGKRTRAEPIAALYEQGRVHHVGFYPVLEDELCNWDPLIDTASPNRLDALVWACTALVDPALDSAIAFGSIGKRK